MSGDDKGDIEVKVTVLNINSGHNPELMKASRTLGDYALFVENVRKYSKTTDNLKKAIDIAVNDMPEESEVGEILRNNRSEVVSMLLEEYTQEYADELHNAELEAETKRADTAEKERDKETERADTAEKERDKETKRADTAEKQNYQTIVNMIEDNEPDEKIMRYTGVEKVNLQRIREELQRNKRI